MARRNFYNEFYQNLHILYRAREVDTENNF